MLGKTRRLALRDLTCFGMTLRVLNVGNNVGTFQRLAFGSGGGEGGSGQKPGYEDDRSSKATRDRVSAF
jgi:hypothetical protein